MCKDFDGGTAFGFLLGFGFVVFGFGVGRVGFVGSGRRGCTCAFGGAIGQVQESGLDFCDVALFGDLELDLAVVPHARERKVVEHAHKGVDEINDQGDVLPCENAS